MTNFLKKKLEGTPEDKARKQQLKQDMDAARWEGRRKGSIERARKEGYRQGKQCGGGIMDGLAEIGAHIDPTGRFGKGDFSVNPAENPFDIGPRKRRSKRSKRRRESDFPF